MAVDALDPRLRGPVRPAREWVTDLTTGLEASAYSIDPAVLDKYGYDRWPIALKRARRRTSLPRPALVAFPTTDEEVSTLVSRAQRLALPLVVRGAGSSVVGGAIACDGGIVVDLQGLDRILRFDEESQLVTVQAGVRGDTLEDWLNQRGYTLGHYPQSLHLSTVGGWVATRASGTFSSAYGNIEDIVDGMRVVLPSGARLSIAPRPRRSVGPGLGELFLGSEGTLGVITEVDLRVRPTPAVRRFAGFRFRDLDAALVAIRRLAQHPWPPAVVRLYDAAEAERLLAAAGQQPGSPLLILGWDGTETTVAVQQATAEQVCGSHGGRPLGPKIGEAWYESRFDVSGLVAAIERPNGLADTIELSMIWSAARAVYRAAVTAAGRRAERVLAHFSHVYPSGTSLYVIFAIVADDEPAAEEQYLQVWREVTEAAMQAGASLSHHHGIGLARVDWMAAEHGEGLALLRDIKHLLDPAGVMNPGKLLPRDD